MPSLTTTLPAKIMVKMSDQYKQSIAGIRSKPMSSKGLIEVGVSLDAIFEETILVMGKMY